MHPKILFATDSLSNGGAERQLSLLVKYLPPKWERRVFSLDEGSFAEVIRSNNVQVDICERKSQFDPFPALALWRLLIDWKPDVIHSWGWMTTLAAAPIAKILRIPLVNGSVRTAKPYYYRRNINKISSRLGDIVISNSHVGLINWGIKPTKGVVIYNGFDKHRIINEAYPINFEMNDKFIVVMAARMIKEKDFTLFIAALRKLLDRGEKNWKFLAIGQGEDKDILIKDNYDLIQAGFLEFPDAGLNVIPFLQTCNVGVLLTKSIYAEEGCSNTIMEYMVCTLPVIATNSGGNKELVEDRVTGFLIPDGGLEDLIDKLIFLFKNPLLSKKMGEKGKERIVRDFTVENMVEKTVSVYQGVMRT